MRVPPALAAENSGTDSVSSRSGGESKRKGSVWRRMRRQLEAEDFLRPTHLASERGWTGSRPPSSAIADLHSNSPHSAASSTTPAIATTTPTTIPTATAPQQHHQQQQQQHQQQQLQFQHQPSSNISNIINSSYPRLHPTKNRICTNNRRC